MKKTNNGSNQISDVSIRRLSSYLRTLDMMEKTGVDIVSSRKLSEIEGASDGLIRKDLSLFGSFGVRGSGYPVAALKENIIKILGLDRKWKIILIGIGETSRIFLDSETFRKKNFQITKIFHNSTEFIGRKIYDLGIEDVKNLEKEVDPRLVDLAVVAVPPPDVQSIIDRLGKIGVKGALYFAARSVAIPDNMVVRNLDVSIELGTLTYHIAKDVSN
jgi:redox-sensing transcriptional repressor